MEIMLAFFEETRPYVTTDSQFKTEFYQETARQYEAKTFIENFEQNIEMTCFSEKNPLAHSRYLKADYEVKPKDIRRLDKVSIPKVKKYVSKIVKFKNAMLKLDESLFSNNGLHLRSPKLAISHDFNKEVLNRIENREEDLSKLLHSLQEKLKGTKEILSVVYVKSSARRNKRTNTERANQQKNKD